MGRGLSRYKTRIWEDLCISPARVSPQTQGSLWEAAKAHHLFIGSHTSR